MEKEKIIKKLLHIETLLQRLDGFGKDKIMRNPLRGQGKVLLIMKDNPGITQKDLGHLLEVRNQSVCELLAKLEKKGYIQKERALEDHRTTHLQLTQEGKEIASKIVEKKKVVEEIFSCFNNEESELFCQLLDKLKLSLEGRVEEQ